MADFITQIVLLVRDSRLLYFYYCPESPVFFGQSDVRDADILFVFFSKYSCVVLINLAGTPL